MRRLRKYTTNDVCNIFDISKSTLFRWENKQSIGEVDRGDKFEREYSAENLMNISKIVLQKTRRKVESVKGRRYRDLLDIQTKNKSIYKLIWGDNKGLRELREIVSENFELSERDIKLLFKYFLMEYFIDNAENEQKLDRDFCEVVIFISEYYCKKRSN